jgi:hypothetical protein
VLGADTGRHWARARRPVLSEPLGSVLGTARRRAGFNTGRLLGRHWELGPALGAELGAALGCTRTGARRDTGPALGGTQVALGPALGLAGHITGRRTEH